LQYMPAGSLSCLLGCLLFSLVGKPSELYSGNFYPCLYTYNDPVLAEPPPIFSKCVKANVPNAIARNPSPYELSM
jgi:hypothetical protein